LSFHDQQVGDNHDSIEVNRIMNNIKLELPQEVVATCIQANVLQLSR